MMLATQERARLARVWCLRKESMCKPRTSEFDARLLRLLAPGHIPMRVPAALGCIVHLTYLPAGTARSASRHEGAAQSRDNSEVASARAGLYCRLQMSAMQRARDGLPSRCRMPRGVTIVLTVSDMSSRVSITARGGSRWLTRLSLSPCTLQRATR